MRGRFITFEGGDGSGKSTHAAVLAEHLKSIGIEVVLTREPGGSTGAEIIRHILLSGITKPMGAETEAILFAAARDDHVRNTIFPAIKAGKWVICDRFIDSTRVYQGALGHVDLQLIRSLERVTVGPAMPDLTFILDVPAPVGLARANAPARRRRRRPFRRRGSGVPGKPAQGLSGARRAGAAPLRHRRRTTAARRGGRAHLVGRRATPASAAAAGR